MFPKLLQNAETLYENTRTKHAEEISSLKSNYEIQLNESRKTIEYLNDVINGIKRENSVLNNFLTEMRTENTNLRKNYEFINDRNEDLQGKLKEATEMTQIKSIDDRKLTSEFMKSQYNVSERL